MICSVEYIIKMTQQNFSDSIFKQDFFKQLTVKETFSKPVQDIWAMDNLEDSDQNQTIIDSQDQQKLCQHKIMDQPNSSQQQDLLESEYYEEAASKDDSFDYHQGFSDSKENLPPNDNHQIESETINAPKKKRRNHTAFKVPLSILTQICKNSPAQNLTGKKILKQIIQSRNNSTGINICSLMEHLGMDLSAMRTQFISKYNQKVSKIYLKWSRERREQADEWKLKYVQVLQEESLEDRLNVVWSDHRHPRKYQNSLLQVKKWKAIIESELKLVR